METADGATYRRNRRDMVRLPDQQLVAQEVETPSAESMERLETQPRRRSRASQPPIRYDPSWN